MVLQDSRFWRQDAKDEEETLVLIYIVNIFNIILLFELILEFINFHFVSLPVFGKADPEALHVWVQY